MPLLFFSFIFIFIFSFFWWGSPHHQVLVHWRFNEIFPPVMAAIKGTAVDPLGLAVDPFFFFLLASGLFRFLLADPTDRWWRPLDDDPVGTESSSFVLFFFSFCLGSSSSSSVCVGLLFFFAKIYWHTKIMAGSRCTAPGNDEHVTSRGRTRKK